MISNPATFFVTGFDERRFTYEGGTTLFHFSPKDNELSDTMECNVIFFANDEAHALDVLRRLFTFWLECKRKYAAHKKKQDDRHGLSARADSEARALQSYIQKLDAGEIKVSLAPTNQFYEVGWASNDTLNVYER